MTTKKILMMFTMCISLGLFVAANFTSKSNDGINLELLDAKADDGLDELDPTGEDPNVNSVIPPFWGGLY